MKWILVGIGILVLLVRLATEWRSAPSEDEIRGFLEEYRWSVTTVIAPDGRSLEISRASLLTIEPLGCRKQPGPDAKLYACAYRLAVPGMPAAYLALTALYVRSPASLANFGHYRLSFWGPQDQKQFLAGFGIVLP